MTGIPEAIAAMSSISTIAKGLVGMRDDNKLLEVKNALLEQVFEVREVLNALQQEMFTLQQTNRDLEQKCGELQKRIDAVDDYELIQLIGGVFVLASKPSDGTNHKPPYFCQTCHAEGKKSPLSFEESAFGRAQFPAHLHCQRNKAHTLNLPGGTQAKSIGYSQ